MIWEIYIYVSEKSAKVKPAKVEDWLCMCVCVFSACARACVQNEHSRTHAHESKSSEMSRHNRRKETQPRSEFSRLPPRALLLLQTKIDSHMTMVRSRDHSYSLPPPRRQPVSPHPARAHNAPFPSINTRYVASLFLFRQVWHCDCI